MKRCSVATCAYLLETGTHALYPDHAQRCPDCGAPLDHVPEEGPPAVEGDGCGDDLVTVATGLVPSHAELLRGRLAAEGIPAFVRDAFFTAVDPARGVAVGGARLQVLASVAARATELLAELEHEDASAPGTCPDCGGRLVPVGAKGLLSAAAAAAGLLMFGTALPARSGGYCPACASGGPRPESGETRDGG